MTGRTVIRYTLMQLPELIILVIALFLVKRYVVIPWLVLGGIISFWVIKDVILYFYTWRAYIPRDDDSMTGKRGIALERIVDIGYIDIKGEKWIALNGSDIPIVKGNNVIVIDRKGLTLAVMAEGNKNAERMQ